MPQRNYQKGRLLVFKTGLTAERMSLIVKKVTPVVEQGVVACGDCSPAKHSDSLPYVVYLRSHVLFALRIFISFIASAPKNLISFV